MDKESILNCNFGGIIRRCSLSKFYEPGATFSHFVWKNFKEQLQTTEGVFLPL